MSETDSVPAAGVDTKEQWDRKARFHTHYITELKLNQKSQAARIIAENKGFSKTFNGIEHVEISGTVRVTYRDGVLTVRGGLKVHAHDNLLLVYTHD